MGFYVQSLDIIIGHLVTWLFKSMYYQTFCKYYCCKTIEASMMIKVPNESKLIYLIKIFLQFDGICSCHMSLIKAKRQVKMSFLATLRNHDILKFVSFLNAFYVRTRSVNILIS